MHIAHSSLPPANTLIFMFPFSFRPFKYSYCKIVVLYIYFFLHFFLREHALHLRKFHRVSTVYSKTKSTLCVVLTHGAEQTAEWKINYVRKCDKNILSCTWTRPPPPSPSSSRCKLFSFDSKSVYTEIAYINFLCFDVACTRNILTCITQRR